MCFVLGDLGFIKNFGSYCCKLRCVDNSGRTLVLSAGSRRCLCVRFGRPLTFLLFLLVTALSVYISPEVYEYHTGDISW